jgi:hypothetical protein
MNVSVKRAFLWVGGPWLLYSPASSYEMSPFPLMMILYAAYPDSVSHRECGMSVKQMSFYFVGV